MAVLWCARPSVPDSNPYDIGELEETLRNRLNTAMLHSPRYLSKGISGLAVVSGFRDPGRQWDLRKERVGAKNACNPAVKAYPATAVPAQLVNGQWVGGSNHQRRTAVDVGGVDLMWLYRNCRRFGLYHVVSTENWHYEVYGDADVKIVPYTGKTWDGKPNKPAPARPVPATPKEWDEMATKAEIGEVVEDKIGGLVLVVGGIARKVDYLDDIVIEAKAYAKAAALNPGAKADVIEAAAKRYAAQEKAEMKRALA